MLDFRGKQLAHKAPEFARWAPLTSLFICLAAYLAVAAPGILGVGFNPDDWRQVAGAPVRWVSVEGRWATHLIFQHVFMGHFVPPLQVALAFVCLAWVSYLLAAYATGPEHRPAAAALIFILGVNHPYMCEALQFKSSVFAYPLALALSLSAFHLVLTRLGQFSRLMDAAVIAAAIQMLAFSCGLYQSFAVFGLVLPILVILRTDRFPPRQAILFAVGSLTMFVAGLALCLLELRLYASLHGVAAQAASGYEPASLGSVIRKVLRLPIALKEVFSGHLFTVPPLVEVALASVLGVTLVLGALACLLQVRRLGVAGLIPAVRIAVAAAAISLLPLVFWFAYAEPFIPPRAAGFVGFTSVALLTANATLLFDALEAPRLRRALTLSLGLFATAIVLLSLVVAAAIWQDRGRVAIRDQELARSIYGRVSDLEGYGGGPIRIIGSTRYDDIGWSGSITESVFHYNQGPELIFRELFNSPSIPRTFSLGPRACHAFPAHDAVFMDDGVAYVCLNTQADLSPLAACATLANPGRGQLCLAQDHAILVSASCPTDTSRLVDVSGANAAGIVESASFNDEIEPLPVPGGCIRAVPFKGTEVKSVEVTFRRIGGRPERRQTIRADQFIETAKGLARTGANP